MNDKRNVTVYSTPTCSYCKRVKDYLSQKGVPYVEYDVAADREKAREMIQKTGQMGVPVTVIDGEVIVGFNKTKLDELLSK